MIHSIRFNTGYPTRLKGIGKKQIIFSGRLNLLIGPNGSGKSTILSSIAASSGCGEGGWSDESKARELPYSAVIIKDTQPVFYQDCYADSDKSLLNPAFFDEVKHLRSTGEKRIGLVNELINYIEERFLTYKLKSNDRPVLLLDEVDNHIGFAGQSVLWKEIFPKLLKKYQLIVSTHSIFPLLLKKESSLRQDNIIELFKDYNKTCISELADAVDFYNKNNEI